MAVTSAIALSIGTTVYSGVAANQQRQKAKGDAAALLRSAPDPSAGKANTAALDAQALQRKRATSASGRGSTILTGPAGITNSPAPATKTLLGL